MSGRKAERHLDITPSCRVRTITHVDCSTPAEAPSTHTPATTEEKPAETEAPAAAETKETTETAEVKDEVKEDKA